MSEIIEKFDVLNKLNDEFKQRVQTLCFANYDWSLVLKGYNVIIVTKDNKTYAFSNNYYNQSGFGHNIFANEIQIFKELCD
jgi:hypothetical protein